jgi:hypothetical protein
VLSSAQADAPTAEFRRNFRRNLSVALGSAGIAATTASSAKAVGGALWLKWMAVGIAIGLAGVGAVSLSTSRAVSHEPAAASTVVARTPNAPSAAPKARAALGEPALGASAESAPEVTAPRGALVMNNVGSTSTRVNNASNASPSNANNALTPSTPVTGPLGTASFAPPAQSALAAETAAIQSARAALSTNHAEQALHQLDQYQRDYPAGLLSLEAEVLRMDCEAKLGDQAAVSRAAARFLSAHPDSPYARHVQALLDQSKNP